MTRLLIGSFRPLMAPKRTSAPITAVLRVVQQGIWHQRPPHFLFGVRASSWCLTSMACRSFSSAILFARCRPTLVFDLAAISRRSAARCFNDFDDCCFAMRRSELCRRERVGLSATDAYGRKSMMSHDATLTIWQSIGRECQTTTSEQRGRATQITQNCFHTTDAPRAI